MPRRVATNVLLALVSVGLVTGAIELGMRRLGLESGRFLRPTRANCMQRSRLLSYEFRPHCDGALSGVTFQTNSLGLRGAELHQGARRIMTVGDSCTFGWAVGQSDSYPMRLQRLLDAGVPSRPFDVINAGVPGYTSYQGLLYLRERGLALEPSIVIIAFGFNDQFEGGDIEHQLEVEHRYLPVLLLDDFLLDRSTTYRWLRWRSAKAAGTDHAPRVPVDRYAANLKDMAGLVRAAHGNVLLLSFWDPAGQRPEYRQAEVDLSAELHIPLVEYGGEKLDFVHPTRDGYQTLAADIFERLRQEGYLNLESN